MNSRSLFVAISLLALVTTSGCHEKPTLTGDWQLVKVDRMYEDQWLAQDSSVMGRIHTIYNASSYIWHDSLARQQPELMKVWTTYFERYTLGWFVTYPDTNKLKWTFTNDHDSELRIYDDSDRIVKRLPSYWTRSDSNIAFTGFSGPYRPAIVLRVEYLDASQLVLSVNTDARYQFPMTIYFKKVSGKPGRDIRLSGIKYEDLKYHIAQKNIIIQKKNKHPFLVDHDRELIITTDDGHIISSHELQTDPGEGCKGSLFDDRGFFLMVDCNGEFYQIDKNTGIIKESGWYWMQDPQKKYLGTYFRGREDDYVFAYDSAYSFDKLYSIKDPTP